MTVVNSGAVSVSAISGNVDDIELYVDTLETSLTSVLSATSSGVGGNRLARKTYSFAVNGGAQGALTLFTVTGTVFIQVFGVCQADITGALATLEVGIAGNTAGLIALTVGTTIDQYQLWKDATPLANLAALNLVTRSTVITNSANVIQTIATANVTAGIIDYYCIWSPLSSSGNVVAA